MSTDMPFGDNGEGVPEQRAYVSPPPEDANPNPVMSAFREKGYDTSSFENDAQFVQTIESGLSQLSEIPQLQQQVAAAQQAPPPMDDLPSSYEEPPQQSMDPWSPPDYDEKWTDLLTVDPDTGKYIPSSEHVNPSVAMRANEYRDWMRGKGKEFWQNPYDFMKPGLETWVRDMIDEQVGTALDQTATDGNVNSFLQANARRFYITDMNGMPLSDPVTGSEMLTPQGEMLKVHAEAGRNMGLHDPNAIQEYALNMLERDLYAQQANQQQYAQQQPQQQPQQQQTFLQEAAAGQEYYTPNRDATVHSASEAGRAQNDGMSFFDMALPELVNMGLVQQTG
jgi:hypothetical protein